MSGIWLSQDYGGPYRLESWAASDMDAEPVVVIEIAVRDRDAAAQLVQMLDDIRPKAGSAPGWLYAADADFDSAGAADRTGRLHDGLGFAEPPVEPVPGWAFWLAIAAGVVVAGYLAAQVAL